MKSFIIIILLIFSVWGCSPIKEVEREVNLFICDFTKYSKKGFLFTPENFNGKYQSVGIIEIEIFPAVIKRNKKEEAKNLSTWDRNVSGFDAYYTEYIDTQVLLDSLYNIAENKGANAVINLRFDRVEKKNKDMILIGKKVSGFAIKRKLEN